MPLISFGDVGGDISSEKAIWPPDGWPIVWVILGGCHFGAFVSSAGFGFDFHYNKNLREQAP